MAAGGVDTKPPGEYTRQQASRHAPPRKQPSRGPREAAPGCGEDEGALARGSAAPLELRDALVRQAARVLGAPHTIALQLQTSACAP